MMNKAIFLDRDGVVNFERGEYTFQIEDIKINEGLIDCLKIWSEKGYLFFVVTNQGGIAKGLYSSEDVLKAHQFISQYFEKENIFIREFLFCPHHPEFDGKCLCRKPESLLFEKLVARNEIDVTKSFMIGDQPRDIQAAEKVGIKSFLTDTNASLKNFVSLIP